MPNEELDGDRSTNQPELIPALRAESIVIVICAGSYQSKAIQILFRKRDGSLTINFPYFVHSTGIVSVVTWQPQLKPPANLSLETGGKVTSHLVKYSHHLDGRAHFSQDGKVYTHVKKQSIPINDIEGHIFTVQLQGLAAFQQFDAAKDKISQTTKRSYAFASLGDTEPEAVKIAAHFHSVSNFRARLVTGSFGPTMTGIDSQGKTHAICVCSAPAGYAADGRVLLVSCESVPQVSSEEKAALTFIGGFDSAAILNDLSKPTSFLAMSYPITNEAELARRLGSIDYFKNQ